MNAKRTQQRTLPVLPLRDVVVFPYMVMPLFVGRAKSISALDEAMNEGKQLLLVSQKQADLEEPTVDDVFDVGTIARRHCESVGGRATTRENQSLQGW